MRRINLIKGDIKFQVKYGFYHVYLFLLILYLVILHFLPLYMKKEIAILIVYSDPAAMGLFFMGAILLLEKSQRVLETLSVSPVSYTEYIFSKIISISFTAIIVAIILTFFIGKVSVLNICLGVFFGGMLFTLIGISLATVVKNLTQFLFASVVIETIMIIPPILYMFELLSPLFWWHPGVTVCRIMYGEEVELIYIGILLSFILIFAIVTHMLVRRMFLSIGGIKL